MMLQLKNYQAAQHQQQLLLNKKYVFNVTK